MRAKAVKQSKEAGASNNVEEASKVDRSNVPES